MKREVVSLLIELAERLSLSASEDYSHAKYILNNDYSDEVKNQYSAKLKEAKRVCAIAEDAKRELGKELER